MSELFDGFRKSFEDLEVEKVYLQVNEGSPGLIGDALRILKEEGIERAIVDFGIREALFKTDLQREQLRAYLDFCKRRLEF
jgi:hypothetical protein